jgi:plastocyanin
VPNNFQPVVYDARNFRLFGQRPDGTLTYVDPNPSTIPGGLSDNGHLLTLEDVGKIIECSPATGRHILFIIPGDMFDDFQSDEFPINSETTIINSGEGNLEVVIFDYEHEGGLKSLNGTQLTGQWAQAVLRCRGQNDWHLTGDIGPNNAKTYSVVNNGATSYDFTGEGLTADPNPTINLLTDQEIIFNINAPGHPFWIKDNQSTGAGVADPTFVNCTKNNGLTSGTFKARFWQAGTYYYNCQHHSSMRGTITVTDT